MVFRVPRAGGETFVGLRRTELLIKSFSDSQLKEIFDELFMDDTVDIIEEMPANG